MAPPSGVGTVITRGAQRAQELAAQPSVFDVWNHSFDGMAARMDAAAKDPAGFLAGDPAQQARIDAAMMPGQWSSASLDQMADSVTAQAGALGDQVQKVSDAKGTLQTIGATFALLTSIEQAISSALSVIPFPAFPAIRITDMDIGLPHAHAHPPNLIPPAPPIPLPSTGPVIPIPILSGANSTLINGMPAARCGDMGIGIWCGGYFPMYEVFLGSSNVWIEGGRAARVALDITKHCTFSAPKPQDPPMGPMIGMTFSSSGNVLIGGVPMPSLLSIGIGLAFKGLAKLAGKGARAFNRLIAPLRRRAGDALDSVTCFMKRTFLGGEPVHLITGEVIVEQEDFTIAGPLPLQWTRAYGSHKERTGACGFGWSTPADARLVVEPDGAVIFYDDGRRPRIFPSLPVGAPVLEFADGAQLSQNKDELVVSLKSGLSYHFPVKQTGNDILVERMTDPCGNYLKFVRDKDGLKRIIERSGRCVEVHSQDGLIREMHLRYLNQEQTTPLVRYDYSPDGELIAVYDALDVPYTFYYDRHRLIRHTDRNGLSFYYAYENDSQSARCHHAWGDHGLYDYHFHFDPTARQVVYTNSLNATWTLQLNEMNLPVWELDPMGGMTYYQYDDRGRNTGVTDPGGNQTIYEYDEMGNLVKLTRPDDKTVETQFNEAGQAVRITDPNGAVWRQVWDDRGLLVRQISPLGAESIYEYDSYGRLTYHTNPKGARTTLSFDAYGFGNLNHIVDALDAVTFFDYDALGNVIGKTDALGRHTRYDYDVKGRLLNATLPSGANIACAYDPEDNLTRYVDENGAVTRLEYFGQGEVKRRLQPDGYSVEYHYDTEEQLIGVTNQRGEHYQLIRDPLGRIIEEIDYWGQSRKYQYNDAGFLKQSVDPLGRTIQYETDPLGRILQKLLPAPYDAEKILTESFAYDPNGNLLACENSAVRIERIFDAEGRLLEERQGEAAVITNTYDPNGNRLTRKFDWNTDDRQYTHTVQYDYDLLDQAAGVVVEGQDPLQLKRNALGQVTQERLSFDVRRSFTYSPDGYLTAQQVSADTRPLFEQTYRYDPAGNLIEKHDSVMGTARFTYDPLGRLVSHLDPENKLKQYLHDPAGDRLQTRVTQQSPDGESPEQWRRDGEYNGMYYRFDRVGNLIERREDNKQTLFRWDANQRLIESANNDTRTHYQYDPLGRRIRKMTMGGADVRFFWDGDALLGDRISKKEVNGNTTPAQLREWIYYPYTFEPLAMLRNLDGLDKEFYLYHNDPNGCPTRLLDVEGEVVWAGSYAAWGGIERLAVDRVDNPIRLQGQYEDKETGLYYNRHRYFEAIIAQFISIDPLGLQPNENVYAFGPNILTWIDPHGLNCWNSFQKALAQARIRINRTMAAQIWDHLNNRSVGRMPRPTVTNPRLQNIINDLYKGDRMPHVLGTGSTADAARIERISGQMIHGRNHIQKATEYERALNNWLRRNPGASTADQAIAQALKDDLVNALSGR